MNRKRFYKIFLLCYLQLCLAGCNGETKQVKKNLELMASSPISLGLEEMECRRTPINDSGSNYKMVVYVDSAECTPSMVKPLV